MVNLKEIHMIGFKSFADETIIKLDGNITAIVGPNGCGKSNVSDAICWVMGEKSSKALRGSSMQDVIFAGSEKRKKLSYCEVSLVFDNSNKWFNVEYEEVVITRKMYRDGNSDYFINNKPCRLRDITEMLHDCNLGLDGYFMIGQGRVQEIVSAKPEDRRVIFEEAVGISKFKKRKEETERRLANVRDNLSRATDILTEVERRLGPLKKQSEDAKKYLELRDKLKQNEINAYIYQFDHASQTKEEINTKLQGYKDHLNVLTNTMETEQAKYESSLNEINQLDKRANSLHEQMLQYTVKLEKKQGDSRLLTEQTKYLKEQLDRLNAQLDVYNLDLNQRETLVKNATLLKEEETNRLAVLRKSEQQLSSEYFALIDQITKSEGEKEESQRTLIDNLSKLTDIKSNLSAFIAKRDTLTETIRQDKENLARSNQNKQTIEAEYNTLKKDVENLLSNKQTKESNITKITEKQKLVDATIEQTSNNMYALRSSISNDTNRMNILSNLQADFESYQFAVKRLLQEGQRNPQLNRAIKGVVGNIINVEEKYQTAIEIALGGSIQNIVTQNEDDAKILINYLKQSNLGRATFLPITAVKPRHLSSADRNFLSMSGCFGVASEIVKTEAQYKPVIESLLGSTVIVDTLDNAIAISRRSGFAFKIVTLEGDVLSPQGSMSGGSKKNQDASILNKTNEINKLKENIQRRTGELKQVEEQFNKLAETREKLASLLSGESASLQSINTEYYTKNTRLENLKHNLEAVEEEIFSLTSKIKVASDLVDSLNTKINSIDKSELDYATSKSQVSEITDNSIYEELKQKRESYQEKLMASRVEIASIEEKINSLVRDINNQTAEIENIKKTTENITREISSQQAVYNEAINLNRNSEEDSELNEIQVAIKDLNIKLSQFDQFKQSLMNEVKELDEKKLSINNEISRLNNKIFQEEGRLQKVDIDIENMQERIYEEYEMTYNDCLPFKDQGDDFDIKETMTAISRIKGQITGLGYVNINALEEYKTEGARFEEMNAQIEDLRKAENDALSIIQDLSKEMLDKFNTEFAKIQENFTKAFKDLFGGGNARLELLPSDDPLTAGVEIVAVPPGKKLDHISLLSGGEKTITAMAILFAIIRLKPMPFCFLDEVEAALDDTNIDRFASYLKRFSNNTQFIIITHKKQTMEVSDSLYGVTMEEKGVSKIVSVKLSDAVNAVKDEEDSLPEQPV